jgi:hypothetical protein
MYSSEIKDKLLRLNKKICCINNNVNNLLSQDILDALENANTPSLTNVFLTEEDLDNYLPQDVIDALTGANTPSALNAFTTQDDLDNYLSQDVLDAITGANNPTALNPFATVEDIANIPDPITVVANYAALPDPTTVNGLFYWAEAAQGTQWLPGNLGGTYYPLGIYYSNGIAWSHIETPYQATQAEVNTGTNTTKFVTPETLKLSTQWDGTVLLAGRSGGQIINGGTASGNNLTLQSTSNATKGKILFGTSAYDEVNNRLGIGTTSPAERLTVNGNGQFNGTYPYINLKPTSWASSFYFQSGIDEQTGATNDNYTGFINPANKGFTWNQGASLSGLRMIMTTTGNVGIGNATPTDRLHVTGVSLTGSGSTGILNLTQTWNTTGSPTAILLNVTNTASGASANLMDLQVGGSSVFNVSKGGITQSIEFRIGLSNRSVLIASDSSNAGATTGQNVNLLFCAYAFGGYGFSASSYSSPQRIYTTGDGGALRVFNGFAPTSGTSTFNLIYALGTINQTGGANGITRGLYINPTLTAAADWRSIEWSNNSGWGLYGAGTASNYLAGSLAIGTTTVAASALLNLNSTTKGFLPPRMTTVQRDAIATVAGDAGLTIFNTTTTKLEVWDGAAWQQAW